MNALFPCKPSVSIRANRKSLIKKVLLFFHVCSDDVPGTPQTAASGSMVVQGNKNLASEKLQRVRKWSITTYKVSLVLQQHLIRLSSPVSSAAVVVAVHSAGAGGEAGPRLPHRRSGPGAPTGASQRRSATLRKRHQARSDAGQSAGAVHRDPEDPGGSLQRAQRQNAGAARESNY